MITTTYLRLTKTSFLFREVNPKCTDKAVFLKRADGFEHCASSYSAVGKAYYWDVYRLGWEAFHWACYFNRPDIQIHFICNEEGQEVGYLELQIHQNASIEIVNFGLRPEFIGQGYGRSSLELVLKHCFDMGGEEVWLHTCSLDHPLALSNYYARGFEFIKEERSNSLPLDPEPTDETVFHSVWMTNHIETRLLRTSNEARYRAYYS